MTICGRLQGLCGLPGGHGARGMRLPWVQKGGPVPGVYSRRDRQRVRVGFPVSAAFSPLCSRIARRSGSRPAPLLLTKRSNARSNDLARRRGARAPSIGPSRTAFDGLLVFPACRSPLRSDSLPGVRLRS
jgi:hypothetical protein